MKKSIHSTKRHWSEGVMAYTRSQKRPLLGLLILTILLQIGGELKVSPQGEASRPFSLLLHKTVITPLFHFAINSEYLKTKQMAQKIDHILQYEQAPLTGSMQTKLAKQIINLAQQYQIDPYLILAIIKVESSFDPKAHSYAGAMGIMQLLPIVIREVHQDFPQYSKRHHEDLLYNPLDNVQLGVHYFSSLLTRFRNDYQLALTAYNMGPTAVVARLKNNQVIPRGYAAKVFRYYRHYQQFQPRPQGLESI